MTENSDHALILLRGLPGSGKSTVAKILAAAGGDPVISIDDYFTDPETGVYIFEYEKNHLAYKDCELRTRIAMESGMPRVFVDNTFTLEWEMEPYFRMAAEYEYRIFTLTVEHRHEGENVHGVSEDQLKRMAGKYQLKLMKQ